MRATRRKAKPGEVLVFHGRLPGDGPDTIVMWGADGATKRHANLVLHGFTSKRCQPALDRHPAIKFGPSFLEDLEAAGFDITTLQFSIRMKPTPPTPNEQEAPRA